MTVRIDPQPFDSCIAGVPIYRANIDGPADADGLDATIPADAALVSLRVPADQAAAFRRGAWREIETLVTLSRRLDRSEAGPLPAGIRRAAEADAAPCGDLAVRAFVIDRYHADPEVDDGVADAAKRAWAENSVRGRAETPLLAVDTDQRVVGFNFVVARAGGPLIDLIAVDPAAQGSGIGRRLIDAAVRVYAGRAERMLVGTQATNTTALALYERCGFRRIAEHVTFHLTRQRIGRAA